MKPESYTKGQESLSRPVSALEKVEQKKPEDTLNIKTFQTKQNKTAEAQHLIRIDVPFYQTNTQESRPSSSTSSTSLEECQTLAVVQKRCIKQIMEIDVDSEKSSEKDSYEKVSHPLNSSKVGNEEKLLQTTAEIQKNLPENDSYEAVSPVRRQIPQKLIVPCHEPNLNMPEISLVDIGKGRDYFSTNQRRRISAMIKSGTNPELAQQMERERYAKLVASRRQVSAAEESKRVSMETAKGQQQLLREHFSGAQKRRISAMIRDGVEPENAKQMERERYAKNALFRSAQVTRVEPVEQKTPAESMEDPVCSNQVLWKTPCFRLSQLAISKNILDLFDDCLTIICRKLELCDQIRFAMTCQKFHDIYLSYCSPKHVTISELDSSLSFMERRYFFEMAGPNIKSITATNTSIWKKCEKRVFNHIFKSTPNIESICLSCTSIGSRCLHTLCRSIQTLISVDLSWCKLCDEDIWVLQKLINLEIIKLEGNARITGRNMQSHRKLKVINFRDCFKLEFRYFKALCKSNVNIHSINIQSCFKVGDINAELAKVVHNLQSLAITCRDSGMEVVCMPELCKLKHLRLEYTSKTELWMALSEQNAEQIEYLAICVLGTCIDMELITRFSGLKTLYISALYFGVRDEHLAQLSKLPNLEMLSITDSIKTDEITTAELLNLFRNCIKLREIALITVFNLTNEFIFAVINVLKERKYQFEKLIKLHVWQGCEINESILEDPRYLAATSFFKLDFEPHIRSASFQWSGII